MNWQSHIKEVKIANVEHFKIKLCNILSMRIINICIFKIVMLLLVKKVAKEFNLTNFLIFRYREHRLSIIWLPIHRHCGHKIAFYERDQIHSWLGR